MATRLRREVTPTLSAPTPSKSIDTIRALCHDLRHPLAIILLLAGTEGGDVRQRLDGITEQAQWLVDMVEAVIGDSADDGLADVEVVDLVSHCVVRSLPAAQCSIGLIGIERATAVVAPVALGRAVSCVLENAVRAAGPGGHVTVEVCASDGEVVISVADDGPGLGQVAHEHSLGLTITRALVSVCGGAFDLRAGPAHGVVARIVLPRTSSRAVS